MIAPVGVLASASMPHGQMLTIPPTSVWPHAPRCLIFMLTTTSVCFTAQLLDIMQIPTEEYAQLDAQTSAQEVDTFNMATLELVDARSIAARELGATTAQIYV